MIQDFDSTGARAWIQLEHHPQQVDEPVDIIIFRPFAHVVIHLSFPFLIGRTPRYR